MRAINIFAHFVVVTIIIVIDSIWSAPFVSAHFSHSKEWNDRHYTPNNDCVRMEFAHLNSILHFAARSFFPSRKAWAFNLWEKIIIMHCKCMYACRQNFSTHIMHTFTFKEENERMYLNIANQSSSTPNNTLQEKLFSKCTKSVCVCWSVLKRIDSRIFFYMQSMVWNLIV